jgi:hypothetical protein
MRLFGMPVFVPVHAANSITMTESECRHRLRQ